MIYHLALPEAWTAAQSVGNYDRSTREQSLAEVGFIHCSGRDQLPGTIAKFYSDLHEVVLLTIDETGLDVRYEPADGQLFPHVYQPLPVGSVAAAQGFSPSAGESPPDVQGT